MDMQHELYRAVAEPCRNFCIFAMIVMIDPKDGREKWILSNCVDGSTGNLIILDTQTWEGESVQFPGDAAAWGLLYLEQYGRLLVSTCETYGYLLSLDMKTRTWAEPLRDENEVYIWNMALGSDGMVYGGTYPGCVLLRYDPLQHTLENLGRVSDNPLDQYSRTVYGGVPGHIIISGGYDKPFLRAYHIESGSLTDFGNPEAKIKQITDDFICTEWEGQFDFYDPVTFAQISKEGFIERLEKNSVTLPDNSTYDAVELANGQWVGVRGQQYFIFDPVRERVELHAIPVLAPPTAIHTLTSDEQGNVWGSTALGQTIFKYNPADGTYWNSPTVCDHGGEVYGMQFYEGKLYLSAYAGGDHIVYDPQKPWDQMNNVNPQTLRSVRPDYIRPTGWTVLGPDDGIWTGWSAQYGKYGGALTRIDPKSLEVLSWEEPVPGQQVCGLTADAGYLYFATNGYASGLPYNEAIQCHFVVWSAEGRIIFKHAFPQGVKLGFMLAIGGYVVVAADEDIHLFDTAAMSFVERKCIGQKMGALVKLDEERLAIFCEEQLFMLNVRTGQIEAICPMPGLVLAATLSESGELFFSWKTVLYQLTERVWDLKQL